MITLTTTVLLWFFIHCHGAPTPQSVTITAVPTCPLGSPLTNDKGELVYCECPPHPFCPATYFCKTEIQGEPGICCTDTIEEGNNQTQAQGPQGTQTVGAIVTGEAAASTAAENTEEASEETTLAGTSSAPLQSFATGTPQLQSSATGIPQLQSTATDVPQGTVTVTVAALPSATPPVVLPPVCPPIRPADIQPLPNLDCKYEDQKPDSNGCPVPPKVVCVSIAEECPKFSMPKIPTGCSLSNQNKTDAKGCPVAPEIVCGSTVAPPPVEGYRANTPPSNCPALSMPKLEANCRLGPGKTDANGCPTIGDIICDNSTSSQPSLITGTSNAPQPTAQTGATNAPICPALSMPKLEPNCRLGPPKNDSNGCTLMGDIICDLGTGSPIPNSITTAPSFSHNCPTIVYATLRPGCTAGPEILDVNGCPTPSEPICTISTAVPVPCPAMSMPKLESHCRLGPPKTDANGCPTIGDIICENGSTALPATSNLPQTSGQPVTGTVLASCPHIPTPTAVPEDCYLEPGKADANGCPTAPQMKCWQGFQTGTPNGTEGTPQPAITGGSPVPTTPVPFNCPAIAMPMLSPGCTLSPSENDANGCPLAPNVTCTSEATAQPPLVNTGSDNSVTKPGLISCPAIEPPTLGPGCVMGPPLTDANGCPLPSKPICYHGHGNNNGPPIAPATMQQSTPGNLSEQPVVDNSITTPGFNNSINCPIVDLPKLAPGCTIGPFVTDANGCHVPGEIICSTGVTPLVGATEEPLGVTIEIVEIIVEEPEYTYCTGSDDDDENCIPPLVESTGEPEYGSSIPEQVSSAPQNCPVIDVPNLAPGCTMGPLVTDANGCQIPSPPVCNNATTAPQVTVNLVVNTGSDNSITTPGLNLNCPVIDVPHLPPGCVMGPLVTDANGCPMPSQPVCANATTGPQGCPAIAMPMIAAGCSLGPEEKDSNGCPLAPKVTCTSATPNPVASTGSENSVTTPGLSVNCPAIDVPHLGPGCVMGPITNDSNGCPIPSPPICANAHGGITEPQVIATPVPNTGSENSVTTPGTVCPLIDAPHLEPGCVMGPIFNDSNGCPMPSPPVCANATTVPQGCPAIAMPMIAAGCSLGPEEKDANGCPLAPKVTCVSANPNQVISTGVGNSITTPGLSINCPVIVIDVPHLEPGCVMGPLVNDTNGCPVPSPPVCNNATQIPSGSPQPLQVVTTAATGGETVLPGEEEVTVPSICTGGENDEENCITPSGPSESPVEGTGLTNGVQMQGEGGVAHLGVTQNVINATGVIINTISTGQPAVPTTSYAVHQTTQPNSLTSFATHAPVQQVTSPIAVPTFKDMLSPEYFLKSQQMPDMSSFHKTFGAISLSSGKFHSCDNHGDCFKYREPREWCQQNSNSTWTSQSCYCSQDTVLPSCIIERTQGGAKQWTFCAEFAQCAVRKL